MNNRKKLVEIVMSAKDMDVKNRNVFFVDFDSAYLKLCGRDLDFMLDLKSRNEILKGFRKLNEDLLEYISLILKINEKFHDILRNLGFIVLSGWIGYSDFEKLFSVLNEVFDEKYDISSFKGYYKMKFGLEGKKT